ncbi:DUF3016 domain-containing protein [Shewanella intestini]|uniref:DUF3016 domain-containing protein n=1 Tax=Shewanella intestini TaxID=2017544 RepID=A0ABS5I0Y5_9GAMM|nr:MULTISPECIES: DUF3016 domain-containing protein [Shewanella]MBR9727581.1 DUF3016 domain-containing protein [Shewanella intestini]MRG35269.1 DUF3016 domain-containing protein [Shewanella sp. XMDDZSB0408]
MKLKILMISSVLFSHVAFADEAEKPNPITEAGAVKIEWQQPDKFRDVKTSNERQSRFEMRLFNTLTENLNKEVQKSLQPNQRLTLQVTNVDLAGDMRPTFGATSGDLRIIKDLYPPKITFSYQLLEGGKVIIAGDENLRDMTFLTQTRVRTHKPFQYETLMLNKWFNATVATKL